MKYWVILLVFALNLNNAVAQMRQTYQNYDATTEQHEKREESITRSKYRGGSNMNEARNLLIVKMVADFKYGDEKLAGNYEEWENDKNFERKMNKVMSQLDNKKMRNTKNREVIRILNEAGNKLYNLLAN